MSTLRLPIQINGDLTKSDEPAYLKERELYIASNGKLYFGGEAGPQEVKPSWSIQSEGLGNKDYLSGKSATSYRDRLILLSEPEEEGKAIPGSTTIYSNLIGRAAMTALTIEDYIVKTDVDGNGKLDEGEVAARKLLSINDVLLNKVRRLCLATGYSYGTSHPTKNSYLNADRGNIQKGQLYFRIVADEKTT